MDQLQQDIRFAVRSLFARPGFTLVAIATLALGIGVNTGMFSIVRAVLLDSLPYAEADRLVRVHAMNPEGGIDHGVYSPPDFEDLTAATTTLEQAVAFFHAPGLSNVALTGAGEAALLESAYVSAGFFNVLGVTPLHGRLPTTAEMQEGSDRVVVLSHAEWQSRFGGDAGIIGSAITLQGGPYTVLAVMPPSFAYPSAGVRAWLPLSLITEEYIPRRRDVRYLGVVARLARGVDLGTGAAEASAIMNRLAAAHQDTNRGWTAARLSPLREELLGEVRRPLLVLSVSVALVLLIAAANLLNLLLTRASSRRAEFAVRSALGAGRGRLARQVITESTVLAVCGGAVGLLASVWLTSLVLNLTGAAMPRLENVRIDSVIIAFALLLSVALGAVTGIVVAARAGHASAVTLREEGVTGMASRQRLRLRGTLVAAEMALAVVLVIAAGLMLRSLDALLRVDPGFVADNVLAVSLTVPNSRAQSLPASIVYRNQLQDRLAAVPGVSAVAVARSLPLERGGEAYRFVVPGREEPFEPAAGTIMVSPEYFATLGIPLLRGRFFDERERRTEDGYSRPTWTHGSIIVNASTARALFGGADAVGERLQLALEGHSMTYEIVGVVGDVRHAGLHEPPPTTLYVAIDQNPRLALRFMLRTAVAPQAVVQSVREAIREVEPDQPIAEILPLGETIARAAARERVLALLLGGFAALALFLAAIGVYGVVAYGVSQRMQEMRIRIALGALPSTVVRLVVAQSALWWGSGLVAGLLLAFASMRVLESLVHGVSVRDAPTFAGVALLLAAAALLASLIPAVRASRADPTRTFR
jgi:predicted permease